MYRVFRYREQATAATFSLKAGVRAAIEISPRIIPVSHFAGANHRHF
jgi:hypothetical protein